MCVISEGAQPPLTLTKQAWGGGTTVHSRVENLLRQSSDVGRNGVTSQKLRHLIREVVAVVLQKVILFRSEVKKNPKF